MSAPTLSPAEARELLHVERGAAPETISRRFREAMRAAHPDLGGDRDLAARLNAARQLLLTAARADEASVAWRSTDAPAQAPAAEPSASTLAHEARLAAGIEARLADPPRRRDPRAARFLGAIAAPVFAASITAEVIGSHHGELPTGSAVFAILALVAGIRFGTTRALGVLFAVVALVFAGVEVHDAGGAWWAVAGLVAPLLAPLPLRAVSRGER
ncbi:hypothetical protein GCM10022286_00510 [Gryllotalpicola daejeonensis]|uniref:J domain-containing protein n=1 Tax=Gryllotalpicola daejeonensis TaxID=993087 RepID=A0ABP7ZCP9_9MICO